MRHRSWSLGICAIISGLVAATASARAAPQTWVSGTGTNSGNCPITAPCRTFQYAHNKTSANGSINVLSPGSFGHVVITKAISIVADGIEAAVLSGTKGAGIIVDAGASDVVSLRGLTIDMRGTGDHGILFVSGAALHVHNSVIRRTASGIRFAPGSGTSELHVADTVIANTSDHGIHVIPAGSGGAQAMLARVRVENGGNAGIGFVGNSTTGSIKATVRDSIAAGNNGTGILATEGSGGTTTVMVDRSAAANNGFGIATVGAGSTIRIGDSTVSGNGNGLSTSAGVIESYGTNKVNGNGTDGAPTSTINPI